MSSDATAIAGAAVMQQLCPMQPVVPRFPLLPMACLQPQTCARNKKNVGICAGTGPQEPELASSSSMDRRKKNTGLNGLMGKVGGLFFGS